MAPNDVTYRSFIDVVGALDHVALDENRNVLFIWSVEMCFMFVAQINVIFMRSFYEAVILCDCIINVRIKRIVGNRYPSFGVDPLYGDKALPVLHLMLHTLKCLFAMIGTQHYSLYRGLAIAFVSS